MPTRARPAAIQAAARSRGVVDRASVSPAAPSAAQKRPRPRYTAAASSSSWPPPSSASGPASTASSGGWEAKGQKTHDVSDVVPCAAQTFAATDSRGAVASSRLRSSSAQLSNLAKAASAMSAPTWACDGPKTCCRPRIAVSSAGRHSANSPRLKRADASQPAPKAAATRSPRRSNSSARWAPRSACATAASSRPAAAIIQGVSGPVQRASCSKRGCCAFSSSSRASRSSFLVCSGVFCVGPMAVPGQPKTSA